ncbi:MAG: hypothetical protein JO024_08365 [Candidatus Eremiobacteraeota bacterium]|nr:hypothetical protein [Candidatus Eremiobacteraeota bacterium]
MRVAVASERNPSIAIWIPMHSKMNADNRSKTLTPVGPKRLKMRSARL